MLFTVWEGLEGTDDQNVRKGGSSLTNHYVKMSLTAATRHAPQSHTAQTDVTVESSAEAGLGPATALSLRRAPHQLLGLPSNRC